MGGAPLRCKVCFHLCWPKPFTHTFVSIVSQSYLTVSVPGIAETPKAWQQNQFSTLNVPRAFRDCTSLLFLAICRLTVDLCSTSFISLFLHSFRHTQRMCCDELGFPPPRPLNGDEIVVKPRLGKIVIICSSNIFQRKYVRVASSLSSEETVLCLCARLA